MTDKNLLPTGSSSEAHPLPIPLEPATIERLIQNQTTELELRRMEMDLHHQQDNHSFEFSKASLEAQIQDRKDDRRFQQHQQRNTYLLAAWVAAIVLCAIGLAMWLNKEQVAMEVIKSIVLLVSGGGIGYGIGRHRAKTSDEDH